MALTPGRARLSLGVMILIAFGCGVGGMPPAIAQPEARPITVRDLLRMSGPELEGLYRQGRVVGIGPGKIRGTAILAPGTRRNELLALGTRLVWQGKIFESGSDFAVNRFFGLPVVRARVYSGPSWHDGASSLVLDYSQTSRVYARYRDEIREVAPGLYLGLMYDTTTNPPGLRMYFALESVM